jgi:hypothetical protein
VQEITQDYLGPAAERFIDRQISMHLNKKPREITQHDLVKLIDWLKLSMALLTNDEHMVNEFTKRLESISKNRRGKER